MDVIRSATGGGSRRRILANLPHSKLGSSGCLYTRVYNCEYTVKVRLDRLPACTTLIEVFQRLPKHNLIDRLRQFFRKCIARVALLVFLFILMGVRVEFNHTRRCRELWSRRT